MSSIILNPGQQEALNEIVKWYNHSSEQLIQVDGEAGTGKSVLINAVVETLRIRNERLLAMAYTGQAAIVMRTKGLMTAGTCHSKLFDFYEETVKNPDGTPMINKQFNTPVKRMRFRPKDFTKIPIDLAIVDEGWMVPYSFRKHILNTGKKILVVGDSGQLPPVDDDPGFFIDGKILHLTELMRQSEQDPIVYLARRARRGLPIEPGLYGNRVLVTYDDEFDNDIIPGADIVICGKNSTREQINQMVRKNYIHTDSPTPIYGERMICKKNNWEIVNDGIALANGLTGTVVRPPKVGNYDGKCFTMDFLPDLLGVPFLDVKCDYKFLCANHKDKQFIRNSKWSVGEKFDWAYASTTHSAQGSEYQNGIYMEEYIHPSIPQDCINYTAITRFKDSMIYVKHRPKYYYVTKRNDNGYF